MNRKIGHHASEFNSALKALNTLADFSIADKHLKSNPIAEVAVATIGLLYRYEGAKKLIPSKSKWCPTRHNHPDSYMAGDFKADNWHPKLQSRDVRRATSRCRLIQVFLEAREDLPYLFRLSQVGQGVLDIVFLMSSG